MMDVLHVILGLMDLYLYISFTLIAAVFVDKSPEKLSVIQVLIAPFMVPITYLKEHYRR